MADSLLLWRRMTVVAAILLIPAAVLLARFADTIVVTLFAEEYRLAVPVFQIYLLVLFREIVDFAVPLRAINRTAPLMYGNFVSLVVNAILLAILLPTVGLIGAAMAFIIARAIEGLYLGRQTAKAYGIRRARADQVARRRQGCVGGGAGIDHAGDLVLDQHDGPVRRGGRGLLLHGRVRAAPAAVARARGAACSRSVFTSL